MPPSNKCSQLQVYTSYRCFKRRKKAYLHRGFVLTSGFTGLLLVQLHRYKHDIDEYESKLL